MKNLMSKLANKFGYEIKKIEKNFRNTALNDILKKKINKNPIIFDVGANKGQSITEFKKIFKKPIIYAFEPIKSEFDIMYHKFSNQSDINLNNYALGETECIKKFNILRQTGASSFYKIKNNSKWIEVRSKEYNTTPDNFSTSTKVKISTLDKYMLANKVKKIDLLKIDTQGYEDKVLEGGINAIQQNKIKSILTEIMFDNVYEKYFSFSDIEQFLLPNNFRMVGIFLSSNNLFDNLTFFADVLYFNKNYYDL